MKAAPARKSQMSAWNQRRMKCGRLFWAPDALVAGPDKRPRPRNDQTDDAPEDEGDAQRTHAGNLSVARYLFSPCQDNTVYAFSV